jgi:SnoaL-like domain
MPLFVTRCSKGDMMRTKTDDRRTRAAVTAVVIGTLLAAWVTSAHAQQSAKAGVAKVAALTPTDYIEIQQLVSKYGYALDSGSPEGTGNEYAGLFTTDGVFVGPGIPDNTVGREKLGALAKIPEGSRTRRGPTYVSHFLMNHLIEPSPEGASGKVYLLVVNFGENGAPSSLSMGGHYEDIYARTSEGWRFKRREFFRGKVRLTPEQAAPAHVFSRPAQTDRKPSGKGPTLTAMDYIEIRQLVAGYAYGLDGGGDNGYNYADLFAPDAVVFGRVTGRENIANLARREPHGPQYTRHFLTNLLIEPTAEGASGKQYLAVTDISENGKPTAFFLGGRYEDTYVKTPQGWRFKTRNLVRAKAATPSPQSGPAGATPPPAAQGR